MPDSLVSGLIPPGQQQDILAPPASLQVGLLPPTIPVDATGAPRLDLIRKFESSGRYNVGYGGADLSKAPLNEFGFPIWEGVEGSAGTTHAAGAYQFEPGTWERYAKPLGIKDFSPESQDAVARAAYLAEGYAPWAPYNTKLKNALVDAGAASPGQTRMAAQGVNLGGAYSPLQPLQASPTAPAGVQAPIVVNMPAMGASPPAQNPLVLWSILQAIMSGSHKFTPVDYDPWKVAGLSK